MSKRFNIAGGFIFICFTVSPALTFAQTTSTAPFCDQIDADAITVDSITGKEEEALQTSLAKIKSIATERVEYDNTISLRKTAWEKENQTQFTALEARVGSTDERTAVEAFKMSIQNAETARETAIANAVNTFRSSLDKSMDSAASSITDAFHDYKSTIESAIVITKGNCAQVDDATAKAALNDSIKIGQKAFRNTVKKIQAKQNLQALVTTRSKAITSANSTFNTVLVSAYQTLNKLYPDL